MLNDSCGFQMKVRRRVMVECMLRVHFSIRVSVEIWVCVSLGLGST